MNNLLKHIGDPDLEPYSDALGALIERKQVSVGKGRGRSYIEPFNRLPDAVPSVVDLSGDRISIGRASDLTPEQHRRILDTLLLLRPWRKGPFNVFGTDVDSEWASDLKWNRLKDHLSPLAGRRVLDIGCSNGYYMFRAAAAGPDMVLGIEPFLPYYYQFVFLNRYIRSPRLFCLPIGIEELPDMRGYFDTALCMGILYHRRSPLDMLRQIHGVLKPGGELVLETLIMEGSDETALCPDGRYAKMNNVFFLPTVPCLTVWLKRSGFDTIRCVSIAKTTPEEQHGTEWIETESLEDFLDPDRPDKTVEGYPAPVRAIVIARRKSA